MHYMLFSEFFRNLGCNLVKHNIYRLTRLTHHDNYVGIPERNSSFLINIFIVIKRIIAPPIRDEFVIRFYDAVVTLAAS